jgi:hypothetical protein
MTQRSFELWQEAVVRETIGTEHRTIALKYQHGVWAFKGNLLQIYSFYDRPMLPRTFKADWDRIKELTARGESIIKDLKVDLGPFKSYSEVPVLGYDNHLHDDRCVPHCYRVTCNMSKCAVCKRV